MKTDGKASKVWLLLVEPKTMGQRIRFLRIAQGMTQTDLARRAAALARWDGLSKSFISLLEAGRTQPSVRTLAAVAEALGASMDWLWTGRPARRSRPAIGVKVRTERAAEAPVRPPRVFVAVTVERDGRRDRVEREVSREAAAGFVLGRREAGGVERSTPALIDAGGSLAPRGAGKG